MTSQQIKTIIGALVAIGLVLAVSYGLISQQTADQIKAQTDQTLSTGQATSPPAPQQPGSQSPNPQTTTPPAGAPPGKTTSPQP